ncbi:MAG TPA: (4Fe-4S)-binding protein [Tepidiformaceae bacterium]|nr:(4Fe-4S)-binding protein [Tepidiformaceae bacterium]
MVSPQEHVLARIQEYRGEGIVVTFDPSLCIHVGQCSRRLDAVFKPRERRWIRPDGASADEIAEVIRGCPSGALQYQRIDGAPDEAPDDPTTVRPKRNGPLYLRGRLNVVDREGVTHESARFALCRCGQSENKPFCDNTHLRVGWQSDPVEPS